MIIVLIGIIGSVITGVVSSLYSADSNGARIIAAVLIVVYLLAMGYRSWYKSNIKLSHPTT